MLNLTRSEQIVIAVTFVALVAIGFAVHHLERSHQNQVSEFKSNIDRAQPVKSNENSTGKQLTVQITGEVENPGIFEYPAGTRVHQALAKAKVKDTGYIDHINQASMLTDGQRLHVPLKKNRNTEENKFARKDGNQKRININQAGMQELEALPGIGPVYAQRIIDHRREKPFRNIEEITRVKGIGLKTFTDIKHKICVQ